MADDERQLYRVTVHYYVLDDLAMLAMERVEDAAEGAMMGEGGDIAAVRVVKAKPATAGEVEALERAEG